jgi:hypothetical protein
LTVDIGGVATFLGEAQESGTALFICGKLQRRP